MPHTYAAERTSWDDQTCDEIAAGDRSVADALALARLLRQLAGRRADPCASLAAAEATLARFGAGPLDPGRFARWQADVTPAPPVSRRRFGRAGEGGPPRLSPLLRAARAAQAWMDGAGFGDRAALPRLRSDAANRVAGWGRPVTWPVAFLHLLAESARMGLRELDRLNAAAETGRGLVVAVDPRAQLRDAIDALLRTPALTPKALAARLAIAPLTGTALLRELQGRGFVREVTGRGSFRAFAV